MIEMAGSFTCTCLINGRRGAAGIGWGLPPAVGDGNAVHLARQCRDVPAELAWQKGWRTSYANLNWLTANVSCTSAFGWQKALAQGQGRQVGVGQWFGLVPTPVVLCGDLSLLISRAAGTHELQHRHVRD